MLPPLLILDFLTVKKQKISNVQISLKYILELSISTRAHSLFAMTKNKAKDVVLFKIHDIFYIMN